MSFSEVTECVKASHKNQKVTGSNLIRRSIGCEVQPFEDVADDLCFKIRTTSTASNIK